jgi:mRNA interferase MazF
VKRGEIWLVSLDPTIGSEIKKSRPCVIISPRELNDFLRTVIVAPMTSKGFAAPFRVPVTHAGTKGLIVLDQVRAVDKVRMVRRLGAVSPKTLGAVLATLQEIFAP